jgi:hypothetical protein
MVRAGERPRYRPIAGDGPLSDFRSIVRSPLLMHCIIPIIHQSHTLLGQAINNYCLTVRAKTPLPSVSATTAEVGGFNDVP